MGLFKRGRCLWRGGAGEEYESHLSAVKYN